jgi:hypothetical protein
MSAVALLLEAAQVNHTVREYMSELKKENGSGEPPTHQQVGGTVTYIIGCNSRVERGCERRVGAAP